MKQSYVLYISLFCLLLTIIFALDDNLSELALVFLALAIAGFGFYIYRRTWTPPEPSTATEKPTVLSRISAILAIVGVLAIGSGFFGLFSDALQELTALLVAGVLMLVLALIVRILDGMLLKKVDGTTGSLSIAAILMLVLAVVLLCLAIYVVYAMLSGLGML